MPSLDRHDRRSYFDLLGDLPEKRNGGHRVEIAGDLREPERRKSLGFGCFAVVEQPGQAVFT